MLIEVDYKFRRVDALTIVRLFCISAVLFGLITSEAIMHPSERDAAIVDGNDADPRMFPWTCALFFNNSYICTSSLISNRDILTAAHCVVLNKTKQPASAFHAICNTNKNARTVRVDFRKVSVHRKFEPKSLENDVAVLHANHPVPTSENVQPICLDGAPGRKYTLAIAMGWGDMNRRSFYGTENAPVTLQWVVQFIVVNEICTLLYTGISDNKICTTGPLTSICHGDSGGPLVSMNYFHRPLLIGITSFIHSQFGCGKLFPTVSTRVSEYLEFIKESATGELCVL